MDIEIKMPQSGTQTEARLEIWHVSPGDHVETGQNIGLIETDKAAIEIEAPATGIITALHVQAGDEVSIDAPLGLIRAADRP